MIKKKRPRILTGTFPACGWWSRHDRCWSWVFLGRSRGTWASRRGASMRPMTACAAVLLSLADLGRQNSLCSTSSSTCRRWRGSRRSHCWAYLPPCCDVCSPVEIATTPTSTFQRPVNRGQPAGRVWCDQKLHRLYTFFADVSRILATKRCVYRRRPCQVVISRCEKSTRVTDTWWKNELRRTRCRWTSRNSATACDKLLSQQQQQQQQQQRGTDSLTYAAAGCRRHQHQQTLSVGRISTVVDSRIAMCVIQVDGLSSATMTRYKYSSTKSSKSGTADAAFYYRHKTRNNFCHFRRKETKRTLYFFCFFSFPFAVHLSCVMRIIYYTPSFVFHVVSDNE